MNQNETMKPPHVGGSAFNAGLDGIRKLTYAYGTDSLRHPLAKCPRCGELFIDDASQYGSILCPNVDCRMIGIALGRGLPSNAELTGRGPQEISND